MLKEQYESARLLLVQSEPALAPQVLAYYQRNREFLKDYDPLREDIFYTEDFQRRALARDLRAARELRALRLWLFRREEGRAGGVTGMVALGGMVLGDFRSAFLSYKLDAGATGRGYMAEALTRLIAIAFEDIGLHRLEANVMPRNARSLALVEKLGFEREGLSRRYLRIGGEWEDHIRLALLNELTERMPP